jgi:hypothetical protein
MFNLFDRDFFKFLIGFLIILIFSFSIFYISALIKLEAENSSAQAAVQISTQ